MRKIVIEPVSRIEGHAKITIHLDDEGEVSDAYFHVLQYRGFEKFCEGRMFWEMPLITSRVCGICYTSHHLASAKACDEILGIEITETARKLRELLQTGEIIQSHALHFFYLASPDLLFGMESEPKRRNIAALIKEKPSLAKAGIHLRKFGQSIFERLSGSRVHINYAIPGGVNAALTDEDRRKMLEEIPNRIHEAEKAIEFVKDYCREHEDEALNFARFDSKYLGLIDEKGNLEFYDGKLRMKSENGSIIEELEPENYGSIINEAVEDWSYMKFPYYSKEGFPHGMYRVGPLARLNVADQISTPLAKNEMMEFKKYGENGIVNSLLLYHYARLIEILHALEKAKSLLEDQKICSRDIFQRARQSNNEGIGIIEAPRGVLIHHYHVNGHGVIQKCNLVVATVHNNLAMNKAIMEVARNYIKKDEIKEGILNRLEVAIRCYDPCLSCATHAVGQMPLQVQIISSEGKLIRVLSRA